jgi:HSP20 family protein
MAIEVWRRPSWPPDLRSQFRDFERTMNRLWGEEPRARAGCPPINVWTGKDDLVLTAELPGVEPDDLDVTVHDDLLTLRCTRQERPRERGATYHRQECPSGGFARSWRLPFEVERDQIEARLENGVLKLTLPRAEAGKPRKVEIQTT